jgi:hypothetical protein
VNRFHLFADHQARYGVKRLCQILNIARSSFYYWKATAADRAARDAADAALAGRIRVVHASHDGTYGAPRITAELHEEGHRVNHKKVARVMRRYRIQGLRLRRRVQTTIADPAATKAPDLIGRDFSAGAVNQRYVGDITYLPAGERGSLTWQRLSTCTHVAWRGGRSLITCAPIWSSTPSPPRNGPAAVSTGRSCTPTTEPNTRPGLRRCLHHRGSPPIDE